MFCPVQFVFLHCGSGEENKAGLKLPAHFSETRICSEWTANVRRKKASQYTRTKIVL